MPTLGADPRGSSGRGGRVREPGPLVGAEPGGTPATRCGCASGPTRAARAGRGGRLQRPATSSGRARRTSCACTRGRPHVRPARRGTASADSRLADQFSAADVPRRFREEMVDRAEFRRTADEMVGKRHLSLSSTLDQGGRIEKSGCDDQGGRPMSGWRPGGRLDACLATCSTTTTSRTSAASSSPPSAASTARFAKGALASCRSGGHSIWWTVEATSEENALALLPFYVAERTTAIPVSEVQIP